MKNIWVTVARNVNHNNNHSYIVGLYENSEDAIKAGKIEEMNRGGKYRCDYEAYPLNMQPKEIVDNEI
jgi:type IV secretory pathway TraG/TraD family ATPase VirD4